MTKTTNGGLKVMLGLACMVGIVVSTWALTVRSITGTLEQHGNRITQNTNDVNQNETNIAVILEKITNIHQMLTEIKENTR